MKKSALLIFGIILTIAVGILLYITLCSSCCCEEQTASIPSESNSESKEATVQPTHYPFFVKDSEGSWSSTDNFNFYNSKYEIVTPISDSLISTLNSLKGHLSKNAEKTLIIKGLFGLDEKNNSLLKIWEWPEPIRLSLI